MRIKIEAIDMDGMRRWHEFSSPREARQWAQGYGVIPLAVEYGGRRVDLGRFMAGRIAGWNEDGVWTVEVEF